MKTLSRRNWIQIVLGTAAVADAQQADLAPTTSKVYPGPMANSFTTPTSKETRFRISLTLDTEAAGRQFLPAPSKRRSGQLTGTTRRISRRPSIDGGRIVDVGLAVQCRRLRQTEREALRPGASLPPGHRIS
jgi:hypothetical protein